LLERKGERFAFLTTQGFKDLCEIGTQARPHLFDLNIRKPGVLYDKVVEVKERVTIEDFALNPFPYGINVDGDKSLVSTSSGETVRILKPLDEDDIKIKLEQLLDEGFRSVAVCLMHAHVFPGDSESHPICFYSC
jgi:5-oxoprolinase (ATP-hydrolysing)